MRAKSKFFKRTVIILALLAAAACIVKFVRVEPADEFYAGENSTADASLPSVTVSIGCAAVLDNYDKLDESLKTGGYIPDDGVILAPTVCELYEGDTVFSILQRVVKANHIQMEYQGSDQNSYGTVYIEGINYLYEFSCGELSGWMYLVNGEMPDVGCSQYEPCDGDAIEWEYTCSLGLDLKEE